jgi:hypothetical protein
VTLATAPVISMNCGLVLWLVREHDGTIEVERGRTGACSVMTLLLMTERDGTSFEIR